jgi:hypothetical protein
MLCAKSNRIGRFTALAVFSAFLALGGVNAAVAQQEPPLTVPIGGLPLPDVSAIPFNSWLLYPSVNFFTENSNNYFLNPQSKISGWAFGVSPSVTAEWSNGIHTTTLYGSVEQRDYPTQNAVDATDKQATFTQKYAPLPDLSFTFLGDYTHQTIASGLTSGIPSPIISTETTVLPNGNTVLPNGTIVSPSGQIVGQAGAAPNGSPLSAVDPYDQFTGTARVEKIFSDGILDLGASVQRKEYDEQTSEPLDFTGKTLTEGGAFWLGSVFYVYSDGSFTMYSNTNPTPDSTYYRVIGGVGTRQIGLFRVSLYSGHQGSDSSGFPSAGGNVYGGHLSYYPTANWTISANIDETINRAPSQTLPSNFAVGTPLLTPVQIPVSSSTQITSNTLQSEYRISSQWSASGILGYTRIQFLGSPISEDAWLADATIKYAMWRNLTLTWEYQYTSITSNAPLSSANRNFITMSALYKF